MFSLDRILVETQKIETLQTEFIDKLERLHVVLKTSKPESQTYKEWMNQFRDQKPTMILAGWRSAITDRQGQGQEQGHAMISPPLKTHLDGSPSTVRNDVYARVRELDRMAKQWNEALGLYQRALKTNPTFDTAMQQQIASKRHV